MHHTHIYKVDAYGNFDEIDNIIVAVDGGKMKKIEEKNIIHDVKIKKSCFFSETLFCCKKTIPENKKFHHSNVIS